MKVGHSLLCNPATEAAQRRVTLSIVKQTTTILGHVVPKGTLIVMSSNSALEDAANPMHTLGPIDGQPPPLHPTSSSSASVKEEEKHKARTGKMVGQWKAGTGRMFDPDRWLTRAATDNRAGEEGGREVFDPDAGPSLPFSLGQRGCFGKNLAVSRVRSLSCSHF